MKTQTQINLEQAVHEGRARLSTVAEIRKSIAAMQLEQEGLAAQIADLLSGVGDATKLGQQAAGLSHAGEILERRIVDANLKIRSTEQAARKGAYGASRLAVAALDEWNLAIRQARGAKLRELNLTWRPVADWTIMLNAFLADSKDFLHASALRASLSESGSATEADSTEPTYTSTAAAAEVLTLADEALKVTTGFPVDVKVELTAPATTAPATKKAA